MIHDRTMLRGEVEWMLFDENGNLKVHGRNKNLITRFGDQWYGEKAAGIGAHATVTGMRLGTGVTAVAKSGAGAAIVTYINASNKALDATPTSALFGASRRITSQTTWNAGQATNSAISEAVMTVENPLTNSAGVEGNTIARALLSPVVDKQAGDVLILIWRNDLLGA
jgi:hypothetical protein